MTSFCTFVTACGASGAEISTTPDVVFSSETKNVEIHDESPDITDESIEIDTDNDNLADSIMIGHYAVNHFKIERNAQNGKTKYRFNQ